jgi:hypothetical protein
MAAYALAYKLANMLLQTIKSYLSTRVLPVLGGKRDMSLLAELAVRWDNHKIMNKWMANLFRYLDTYYVRHHNLPMLVVRNSVSAYDRHRAGL